MTRQDVATGKHSGARRISPSLFYSMQIPPLYLGAKEKEEKEKEK